jgi:hypothetical protein
MPFGALMDSETERGTLVFWRHDPDAKDPKTKKPLAVRFRLRRVDADWDRETRKRIAKAIGGKAKLTGDELIERQVRLTRDRAAYALLDSENFSLVVDGPNAVQYFNEQLKPETPLQVGDVVKLDGKWTAELKNGLFKAMPELASWISDKSDELKNLEAEEEEEETESFR